MAKHSNIILSTVLLLVSISFIYFFYHGNSKLNEAVKIINDVKGNVSIVKDSLQNAQNSIQSVLKKLEIAENELEILRAERNILELEEQKKKAKNWEELQLFKEVIKKLQYKKAGLLQEAKKFEL